MTGAPVSRAEDRQRAHVGDKRVVAEAHAPLGHQDVGRARGVELGDDVLHVPGREKLPLLDVDRPPGLGRRDQKIGLAAQEGRNLQRVDGFARPARIGRVSCTSVITGRPSVSRISAKIGSAALSPTPRAAEPEVRLALSKDDLKTRPMARRAAISFSACSHFERVGAAFELAGPGDQRQRQRGAEPGRERPLADLNDGVVAQRNVPLSAAALSGETGLNGKRMRRKRSVSAADGEAGVFL